MFNEIMIKLLTTILSFYLNHQHAPYEKLRNRAFYVVLLIKV